MKNVLSSITAALVAVAFAGAVFAAEPATQAAPALPAGHPPVKVEEKKAAEKKVKKAKKTKKAVKKEEAKPAATPAVPATPAAK